VTNAESPTTAWRGLTVGLAIPDVAFGAAVDVDDLLVEPELHFTAAPSSSRLLLMPRAGSFTRLLLEWENLPEIGVFTAGTFGASPLAPGDVDRLETWMRDVAVLCHAARGTIREAAERAVRDAALGLDTSLPEAGDGRLDGAGGGSAHVVSARVGTSVAGPLARYGVVDVIPSDESHDEMWFVARATGARLGRRQTVRVGGEVLDVVVEPLAPDVRRSTLTGWFDQHIAREVLFDDVWQANVHLLAGLDAPASIRYFE